MRCRYSILVRMEIQSPVHSCALGTQFYFVLFLFWRLILPKAETEAFITLVIIPLLNVSIVIIFYRDYCFQSIKLTNLLTVTSYNPILYTEIVVGLHSSHPPPLPSIGDHLLRRLWNVDCWSSPCPSSICLPRINIGDHLFMWKGSHLFTFG